MKTEKALFIASILSVMLAFTTWPGGNEMMMISLTLLGVIYFPGGFYFFCDKSLWRQKAAVSIAAGFGLSSIVIGSLFKLELLSGARELLQIGLFTSVAVAVTSILLSRNDKFRHANETISGEILDASEKHSEKTDLSVYFRNMIFRLTIWIAIGTGMYLISYENILAARFPYMKPEQIKSLLDLTLEKNKVR